MKNVVRNTTISLLLLVFTACVSTRDPNLVAVRKNGDDKLNCKALGLEYKSNTEIASAKVKSNRKHDRKELWYGIFIWPGLMDFKNADGIEANSMLDRNIEIKNIAVSKSCDVKSWPAQPARY